VTSLWTQLGLHGLRAEDLLQLALHYCVLSMLAVGGAISTAADMQRYLVEEQGWMTTEQFSASIAIAQAAPGPNILFVALMGWTVAGPAGMLATMIGIMLPSSVLAMLVGRYGRRRAEALPMRAFTTGMVPLTIGLLVATGWLLTEPSRGRWPAVLLVLGTVAVMVRTKLGPLWLIAVGAIVGALGGA
jgi:chromate transporter